MAHTSYELLNWAGSPSLTASAITAARDAPATPSSKTRDRASVPPTNSYNAAAAAWHWIDDHRDIWDHGSDTDAGTAIRWPCSPARAEPAAGSAREP